MNLNERSLTKIGQFFETSTSSVTDRAVLYVIDDVHYRIDDDGCWFFDKNPHDMGWARCEPPTILNETGV